MKLTIEHIKSLSLPYEKLAFLEIAQKLDSKLMPFLLEELSLGNYIYDAYENFNDLCVSLIEPFKKVYRLPEGVNYYENSDSHYNYAEYKTIDLPFHVLTAPFE